jgi:Uma2 family endonuclease
MLNPRQHTPYTYKDYLKFTKESDKIELINGEFIKCVAPSRIHQHISIEVSSEIRNYIKSKKGECKVYTAPFDVRLIKDTEDDRNSINVIQPDITIICDKNKLDDKGCKGTPDFIAEIVSPSSKRYDYVKKLNIYQDYGVKEYWIINPIDKTILVYLLNFDENDFFYERPILYSGNVKVKINVLEDCKIDFSDIWE